MISKETSAKEVMILQNRCIGVKEPFHNSQEKVLWENESGGETRSWDGVRYAKMGKLWEAMQVEWKASTVSDLGKGSRTEFNPWVDLVQFQKGSEYCYWRCRKASFLPVLNLLEQRSQGWIWLVNGKEILSLISGAATHNRFWISTIHFLELCNPKSSQTPKSCYPFTLWTHEMRFRRWKQTYAGVSPVLERHC